MINIYEKNNENGKENKTTKIIERGRKETNIGHGVGRREPQPLHHNLQLVNKLIVIIYKMIKHDNENKKR